MSLSDVDRHRSTSAGRTSHPSRRRLWTTAPLAVVSLAFVIFALWPYVSLDPGRSRIPPPADVPAYYPLLVAHVVFGSTAMLTCCVQLWPWFRQRRPDVHRTIGRVYVFGGVLPAGLLGLIIGATTPFGPIIRASNVLLALLWLATTLTGYRMARLGRFVEHRRWMIRSFALTMSIITNRVWGVIWFLVLSPQLQTTFGGSEPAMIQAIAGLSGWLGWTLPLIAAEWWLDRELRPAGRTASPRSPSGSAGALPRESTFSPDPQAIGPA